MADHLAAELILLDCQRLASTFHRRHLVRILLLEFVDGSRDIGRRSSQFAASHAIDSSPPGSSPDMPSYCVHRQEVPTERDRRDMHDKRCWSLLSRVPSDIPAWVRQTTAMPESEECTRWFIQAEEIRQVATVSNATQETSVLQAVEPRRWTLAERTRRSTGCNDEAFGVLTAALTQTDLGDSSTGHN